MNKNDFIKIGEQRINKSMIVSYWSWREGRVAIKTAAGDDNEYIFSGTLADFEALLFDEVQS